MIGAVGSLQRVLRLDEAVGVALHQPSPAPSSLARNDKNYMRPLMVPRPGQLFRGDTFLGRPEVRRKSRAPGVQLGREQHRRVARIMRHCEHRAVAEGKRLEQKQSNRQFIASAGYLAVA